MWRTIAGSTQVVNIDKFLAQTPQSTVDASGVLGVNKGDPLTALRLDASVRDLGEYDQLLTTLGVQSNGKKGSAALPIACCMDLWASRGRRGATCGPGCEGASAGERSVAARGNAGGRTHRFGGGGCGVCSRAGFRWGELDDQARECGADGLGDVRSRDGWCRGAAW